MAGRRCTGTRKAAGLRTSELAHLQRTGRIHQKRRRFFFFAPRTNRPGRGQCRAASRSGERIVAFAHAPELAVCALPKLLCSPTCKRHVCLLHRPAHGTWPGWPASPRCPDCCANPRRGHNERRRGHHGPRPDPAAAAAPSPPTVDCTTTRPAVRASSFEASRAGDSGVDNGEAAMNSPGTPRGDQGHAATDTGACISTQDRIDAVIVGPRAALEHNRDDGDDSSVRRD